MCVVGGLGVVYRGGVGLCERARAGDGDAHGSSDSGTRNKPSWRRAGRRPLKIAEAASLGLHSRTLGWADEPPFAAQHGRQRQTYGAHAECSARAHEAVRRLGGGQDYAQLHTQACRSAFSTTRAKGLGFPGAGFTLFVFRDCTLTPRVCVHSEITGCTARIPKAVLRARGLPNACKYDACFDAGVFVQFFSAPSGLTKLLPAVAAKIHARYVFQDICWFRDTPVTTRAAAEMCHIRLLGGYRREGRLSRSAAMLQQNASEEVALRRHYLPVVHSSSQLRAPVSRAAIRCLFSD